MKQNSHCTLVKVKLLTLKSKVIFVPFVLGDQQAVITCSLAAQITISWRCAQKWLGSRQRNFSPKKSIQLLQENMINVFLGCCLHRKGSYVFRHY